MLTDPDTYRARKERASGPADFPQRGTFCSIRLVPSLAQAFNSYFEMDFGNQFSTSDENNIWKQCM